MSRLLGLTALVAAMVLLAGCGGGKQTVTVTVEQGATGPTQTTKATPDQDPGDFMKEITQEMALKQWGKMWTSLHTGQQALISSSDFDVCMDRETSEDSYEIKSLKVLDVYDDPLQLQSRGIPQKTSKAVTLKVTYSAPGQPSDETSETGTSHAVAVNGQWKWILTDDEYKAFKQHQCTDGTPFPSGASGPPPPTSTTNPSAGKPLVLFGWRGNGTKQLRPVTVPTDSTLYWTHGGPYSFNLHDKEYEVEVSSEAKKGNTFVPAGTYRFEVSTEGDWTIDIK
jgi:hypothetical protein